MTNQIRQKMNILISPSNNRLLVKAKTRILTQFGKKKTKKNIKIISSFCFQTLFLMLLLPFAKKILLFVDKYFEIIFSLVLDLACN